MRSLALSVIGSSLLLCCHARDPAARSSTKSAIPDKDPCPDLSWVESAPLSPPLPDRSRDLVPGPKHPPTANDLAWARHRWNQAQGLADKCVEEQYYFLVEAAYELSGSTEMLFVLADCLKFRNPAHSYAAFALYAERMGAAIDPAHPRLIEELLPMAARGSISLDLVCQEPGFEVEIANGDVLGVSPIAATWRTNWRESSPATQVTIKRGDCRQTKIVPLTNVGHTAITCRRTSR
jgi:hypothetical protein